MSTRRPLSEYRNIHKATASAITMLVLSIPMIIFASMPCFGPSGLKINGDLPTVKCTAFGWLLKHRILQSNNTLGMMIYTVGKNLSAIFGAAAGMIGRPAAMILQAMLLSQLVSRRVPLGQSELLREDIIQAVGWGAIKMYHKSIVTSLLGCLLLLLGAVPSILAGAVGLALNLVLENQEYFSENGVTNVRYNMSPLVAWILLLSWIGAVAFYGASLWGSWRSTGLTAWCIDTVSTVTGTIRLGTAMHQIQRSAHGQVDVFETEYTIGADGETLGLVRRKSAEEVDVLKRYVDWNLDDVSSILIGDRSYGNV